MLKRVGAWWRLAEGACARVAWPRTEVVRADAEVEALVRHSWIGSRVTRLMSSVDAAWIDSRCRRILRGLARPTS